jgi:hypothetical protein
MSFRQTISERFHVFRVVRMYLRGTARTFRLHNYTHGSHLTLRITNHLSLFVEMALRQRWPQQAAHEDRIGTIPARRRTRTKFVLLIKTDIARLLSGRSRVSPERQ